MRREGRRKEEDGHAPANLKVSKTMVKRTNLPRRGRTLDVGGIISAKRRKNTVRDSKMLMLKLTYKTKQKE